MLSFYPSISSGRIFPLTLLLASGLTLSLVYISQYGFGLLPCELCLWQRIPHWVVLISCGIALSTKKRLQAGLLLAAALALVVGAGIACFHIGVEQKWWPGLASCGGVSGASSIDALRGQLLGRGVARCDEPAFVFLSISMAGWNALISIILGIIAFTGSWKMLRSAKRQ